MRGSLREQRTGGNPLAPSSPQLCTRDTRLDSRWTRKPAIAFHCPLCPKGQIHRTKADDGLNSQTLSSAKADEHQFPLLQFIYSRFYPTLPLAIALLT